MAELYFVCIICWAKWWSIHLWSSYIMEVEHN